MAHWEARTLRLGPGEPPWDERMAPLGLEGWELVAVVPESHRPWQGLQVMAGAIAFFKRRVPD